MQFDILLVHFWTAPLFRGLYGSLPRCEQTGAGGRVQARLHSARQSLAVAAASGGLCALAWPSLCHNFAF